MRRVWILVVGALAVLAVSFIGSSSAQAVGQSQYFANSLAWVNAAKAAGQATFPAVAARCPKGVKVAPTADPNLVSDEQGAKAAWDGRGACTVFYNFRTGSIAASDYQSFCALTVHEYGHLATGSVKHSSDPSSVMHHPVLVVPPACGSGNTRGERITPS